MHKPRYTDYNSPDAYYEACCEYAIVGDRTDDDSYYYDEYYDDSYEEDEYEREDENKWEEN